MQAVILVAGKSTRTYPLTLTRPKPLLPVLNRPLIYFSLDQLTGLVNEVILIVGYRKEMIEDILGCEYKGIKIIYKEQKEQLGTGHALLQAAPYIKERFIAMNGDDLFARVDIEKLLTYQNAALAMKVPEPSQFGVCQVNQDGHLINFIEKPKSFIGDLTNVGCYVFEPAIFSALKQTKPSERGEIELPAAMLEIAKQKPLHVVNITGFWLATGFPWDLLRTQRYLFDNFQFDYTITGEVEKGALVHGPVYIEQGSIIKSGAQIYGPVFIGKNCEIGALSYIGPYTSLGHQVKVNARSVIEESIIMENCLIDTGAIIRHSVVGSNVRLDEGCHLISRLPDRKTIQSFVKGHKIDTKKHYLGAILSDNIHLGARTLITPGNKLWPGVETSINTCVESDIIKE